MASATEYVSYFQCFGGRGALLYFPHFLFEFRSQFHIQKPIMFRLFISVCMIIYRFNAGRVFRTIRSCWPVLDRTGLLEGGKRVALHSIRLFVLHRYIIFIYFPMHYILTKVYEYHFCY